MNSRRYAVKTIDGTLGSTNSLRHALRLVAIGRGDRTIDDTRPEKRRRTQRPVYVVGNR